jgi:hypothetical protein
MYSSSLAQHGHHAIVYTFRSILHPADLNRRFKGLAKWTKLKITISTPGNPRPQVQTQKYKTHASWKSIGDYNGGDANFEGEGSMVAVHMRLLHR